VEVKVEEDTTDDTEMNHTGEEVHYLAMVASVQGETLTGQAVLTETAYYHFGRQRVAMRKGDVVYYTAGDHLGTTSLVLRQVGSSLVKVAESRHYPYGEIRWTDVPDGFPTDYRFTGQRLQAGLGLYHMGARFYDAALGRWISADTLVPDPANPQLFNRYSYVRNSPLFCTDPSGHGCKVEDGDEYCADDVPDELLLDGPPDWLLELLTDPNFVALLQELLPDITGGMRVEGTWWIIPFAGIDANLDFVGNLSEMDGAIHLTIGLQGGFGIGASINTGPVFGLDETSVAEWDEIKNHLGATMSDDILTAFLSSEAGGVLALFGLEPDYGWGSPTDEGHRPQSFFLGLAGLGEEGSPLWLGAHVLGIDLLSGDASFGFGSRTVSEGNVGDILDSIISLFVDQGSGE
jgi:RHS repeat-associated protein